VEAIRYQDLPLLNESEEAYGCWHSKTERCPKCHKFMRIRVTVDYGDIVRKTLRCGMCNYEKKVFYRKSGMLPAEKIEIKESLGKKIYEGGVPVARRVEK
jgi:hypothetical protein